MKNFIFIKRINLYLAKTFLIKFLQVLFAFALIVFFINFTEALDKTADSEISVFIIIFMAFLNIPDFLNEIVPSIILFSAIITFFTLSIKNEITIIRNCGYSLWNLIFPIVICAFLLGIFWITVFGPVSIEMIKKFNSLERQYVKKELREAVESSNGIWLRQDNLEIANEEIVIQAKKVYKENIELQNVSIWFVDKNSRFYKKIYAKEMSLKNNYWILKNVTIDDFNHLGLNLNEMSIKTNLKDDFIRDKIVSNFENVKLFSIFSLPKLIKELDNAGFKSTKFQVYLQSLFAKPILFVAMIMIACFFGINNSRNKNSAIVIFLGILSGLFVYIFSSFVNAIGSSGLIPIFSSTWLVVLIFLMIGILLIYNKENV